MLWRPHKALKTMLFKSATRLEHICQFEICRHDPSPFGRASRRIAAVF